MNVEPAWLNKGQVLRAHQAVIDAAGGSHGIRDDGLLESALARAEFLYNYEDPDVFELAAIYAEGIVKNHPFIDGNKRTGYATAGMFLSANGYRLSVNSLAEQAVLFEALAEGKVTRKDLADFYRQHTSPR